MQLEARWGFPSGETQKYIFKAGRVLTACALPVWLCILVYKRTGHSSRKRASLTARWIAPLLGAAAAYISLPVEKVPLGQLGTIALDLSYFAALSWLALEVAIRHSLCWRDLGIKPSHTPTTQARVTAFNVFSETYMYCVIGGMILSQVIHTFLDPMLKEPGYDGQSQEEILHLTQISDAVGGIIGAVVTEDLIMVAMTVSLLRLTRCPAWAMYTLVGVLELALHVYTGLVQSLFVLPFALSRVYLYRRFGRLTPSCWHTHCGISWGRSYGGVIPH